MRILIQERSAGIDEIGKEYWDIDVIYDLELVRHLRLSSPWSTEQENECSWYVEVFASSSGSPFEGKRAQDCHDQILEYGKLLHTLLGFSDLDAHAINDITIDVVGISFGSTLHTLHWETLEQRILWHGNPKLHVRRSFVRAPSPVPKVIECNALNILLVIARPHAEDIEYLSVAQKIVQAIQKAKERRTVINIEIVRPGTWEAMLKHLDIRRPKGYFQLIHLDVHGLLIEQGPRKGIYLQFLDKSGTTARFKNAIVVGKTLRAYQIQAVVLNACKSASSRTTEFQSLPASFLEAGIPVVVAMSANISSMAAEKFVAGFYLSFLTQNQPFHIATSIARSVLAKDSTRNARFGYSVQVDDWIIPAIYVQEDVRFTSLNVSSELKIHSGSTDNLITRLESMINSSKLSELGIQLSEPAFKLVCKFLQIFESGLVGRDKAILYLENTFLLGPKSQSPNLRSTHVHIYGRPGIGKSALLAYLCWWWQITSLFDTIIYIDCHLIEPWSIEKLIEDITQRLGKDVPAPDIEQALEQLNEGSKLLMLDGWEVISKDGSGITDDQRAELAEFLDTVHKGCCSVITASRDPLEPFMSIIKGDIRSMWLPSLTSSDAMKLAQVLLSRRTEDVAFMITDPEEFDGLQYLMEFQEFCPAAIEVVIDLTCTNTSSPRQFLSILRDIEPLGFSTGNVQSKRQLEIEAIMVDLASKAQEDSDTADILLTVVFLSSLNRRFPLQIDTFLVHLLLLRECKVPTEFELSFNYLHEISIGAYGKNTVSKWPGDIFREARKRLSNTINFLKQHDLIWLETLRTIGGFTTHYWHLDPVFSVAAKLRTMSFATITKTSGDDPLIDHYKIALAQYYEHRVYEFTAPEMVEAGHSLRQILFELENICAALGAWLSHGEPMKSRSLMTYCLASSFDLLTLEKQDILMIKAALCQVAEFYEASQLSLSKGDEVGRPGLENYLTAIGQLQSISFAEEDWPQVRDYTARIRSMLEQNQNTLKDSPYAQDHQAQTSEVEGYEMFSRREFSYARIRFQRNLAELPVGELPFTRQVARAKLRMMNLLGLLKCDFEDLENGEVHIRQLDSRYQSLKQASDEYAHFTRLSRSSRGWAAENQRIEADHRPIGQYLSFIRDWTEDDDKKTPNVLSAVSDLAKSFDPRHEVRQNASTVFLNTFRDTRNFSDTDAYINSLLNGLENAYRNNADVSTLAQLYHILTSAHVHLEKFDAAMEYHRVWCGLAHQMRRSDSHTQLYEEYVFAVCYYHTGKLNESRQHLSEALAILEKVDAKRIKFSCLHTKAMLDLGDGEFEKCLDAICSAGELSYQNEDEKIGQPGSTLKILAYVVTVSSCASNEYNNDGSKAAPITEFRLQEVQDMISAQQMPQGTLDLVLKCIARKMGIKTYLRLMKYLMENPSSLLGKNGSLKWDQLERLIFEADKSSGFDHYHFFMSKSIDECPRNNIPLNESDAAKEKLSGSTEPEITPSTSENIANGNTEDIELAALMLMRVTGTIRWDRQRSVLWYLAGNRDIDTTSMPKEYAEYLQNVHDLDAGSRVSLVEAMVKAGNDVDIFDERGTTPFMRALAVRNLDIANVLLEAGAEPNRVDFCDETVLHHAVMSQDLVAVKYCIGVGCSPHLKNARGRTPLALAVQLDDHEICRSLINSGANVLARDNVGVSCIMLAMKEKQHNNMILCLNTLSCFEIDIIRAVLLDYGFSDCNFIDYFTQQFSELEESGHDWIGYFNSVFVIPEDFAMANLAGQTPYHRAAWQATPEIINQFFAATGADANTYDDTVFGFTPAMAAGFNPKRIDLFTIIASNDGNSFNVKSSFGDISAAKLLIWSGLELTINDQVILDSQAQGSRIERIALHWTKSARLNYYSNLSDDAMEQLVGFRRQLAFEDETSSSERPSNPFYMATYEVGHDSTDQTTLDESGMRLSRLAKKARYMEHALTRDIKDGDTDDFVGFRFEVAWKGNLRILPQIYHVDRHGRCRHVQAAADREDLSYRIWISDEYGTIRGVLGAFKWGRPEEDNIAEDTYSPDA